MVGNWGRWGDDDERGAVNLLTPERVMAALSIPTTGRVIALGSEVGKRGALTGGRNSTWHLSISVQHPTDAGRGRAEDTLTLHTHAHSHMDGLAHIWHGGQLYNGFPSTDVGRGGANRLSIGDVGGIVTRGVFMDLTEAGERTWQVGELIEVDDLQRALDRHGTTLAAGDAIIIRTGWFDLFKNSDPAFDRGEPGLSNQSADWLAARDPVLVGMDNSALEPLPAAAGSNPLYVHETFLRDHGIYMLELLDLSELASGLADAGKGTFLFMASPLQIDRGLGSPINPLAIV